MCVCVCVCVCIVKVNHSTVIHNYISKHYYYDIVL